MKSNTFSPFLEEEKKSTVDIRFEKGLKGKAKKDNTLKRIICREK